MTTGAGLVTAGFALAATGSQPGDLELMFAGSVVTSGPLTQTPTWKATTACPAGYRVSAQVAEFTTSGTEVSRISPVTSVGLASPGFTGSLDGNVGALLKVAGISTSDPGTLKWVVGCWNGASGTGTGTTPVVYEQATFVTATSAGTYRTSSSSPTASPTASPTPSPTASPTPSPTSSGAPSGGAQTGAGGASLPGGGNDLLIALGATLLAGSAAAAGLAVRRTRARPGKDGPGGAKPAGN